MSLNLKEIFEKDYVKGYFHRNKKILLLSLIIFLLMGSIGNIIESDPLGIDGKKVSETFKQIKLQILNIVLKDLSFYLSIIS